MSWSHLSPEQAERAEQIFQSLRQATEADARSLRAVCENYLEREGGKLRTTAKRRATEPSGLAMNNRS